MRTGTLRVATAIRALGVGFAWFLWVVGAVAVLYVFKTKGTDDSLVVLFSFAFGGAFFWALGKGLAWIIEGFAPEA